MLDRKADIIKAMPEWRPEVWRRLEEHERWEVIERTEQKFAALERRDPTPIKEMEQRLIERLRNDEGFPPQGLTQEQYGNPIDVQLGRKFILETEPDRVMLTYFHEEHHLEQLHAIRRPDLRGDFPASHIEAWETSRRVEDLAQRDGRAVSDAEYKNFAHEQSARLESTRLFARCLNEGPALGDTGNPGVEPGSLQRPEHLTQDRSREAIEARRSRAVGELCHMVEQRREQEKAWKMDQGRPKEVGQ